MELPHLRLAWLRFQRRFLRRGLPVLGFWALLSALRSSDDPWFNTSLGISVDLAILLGGNIAVYYLLAQELGRLALEPTGIRESRADSPGWHLGLLSNAQAVLGMLVSGVLVCLPTLLGLLAYLFASLPTDGPATSLFQANLWLATLRMLHFALASACITLALRRSLLAPFLPALLAVIATLLTQWDLPSATYTGLTGPLSDGLPAFNDWQLTGLLLASGLLLLIALQAALVWACRHGSGPLLTTALTLLVVLPGLLGVLSLAVQLSLFVFESQEVYLKLWPRLTSEWLAPLHAMLLHVYADVYPLWSYYPESGLGFPDASSQAAETYVLYYWSLAPASALALTTGLLLFSLACWWQATLSCLRAVRQPADPAAARTSEERLRRELARMS